MIDPDYLDRLEHFFTSGDLEFEFEHGDEEKRYAILDFLDKLMTLADQADELATRLIFKDGYMEMLSGVKAQK